VAHATLGRPAGGTPGGREPLGGNGASYANNNALTPGLNKRWGLPPQAHADFVCAMAAPLEVSHRPYTPPQVLGCLDAPRTQQVKATRKPIAGPAGKPHRYEDAYEPNGVSNLFMIFAPLAGWRPVQGTDRRTNVDFAHCLPALGEEHVFEAQKIVWMADNWNPHNPAALYEAVPPSEARRIREKIAWHHTPQHGSWRHMAESALRVLQRQCCNRRLPEQETLKRAGAAWEPQRHHGAVKGNWRVTTEDARIKVKKLYPSF
jgi:hypothetical protein